MSRLRTMAEKSLVTAGVTSALSGVVIAVVANVPGDGGNEYQRTGRRPDDPESWSTGLALALTFACLAWVWALWATRNAQIGRRRRARAVASSVFAAGCAAALVVVVLRMPTPGPSGGVDMSLPLMLLAFALAAVGALATATSSLCRPDEDPLLAAAGTAVFAENVRTGSDDETRYSTALHAFDVRTGEKSWSHTIPDAEVRDLNDVPGPQTLLRDGQLFVAYRESTATGEFDGCAMAAWNITTGERHDPFQPDAAPDDEWCLTRSLEAAEIPGAVALHLKEGTGAIFTLD